MAASEALRSLLDVVDEKPKDKPITWGELRDAIEQAERWQATAEWETYMGEDL